MASGGTVILGDVDQNGSVDVTDARLALRYAIKTDTPTESQKNRADYDRNSIISVDDARHILRTAIGIETEKTIVDETLRYFDNSGNEIPGPDVLDEGATYIILYPDGRQEEKEVPITTPKQDIDLHHCAVCGKNSDYKDGHSACYYGGCTRWLVDIICPECGAFVRAGTCHTCR